MENTYIRYEQALSIIAKHKIKFPIHRVPLEDSIGDYLADDLIADRDFPPFDRVTMDGIAINYSTFDGGQRAFSIEATAAAGAPRISLTNSANCIEIMTGAILPKGVDTVIRYEDVTIVGNTATITVSQIKHKQNVHFQGMDIAKGTIIVPRGKQLSSAEINIAASIGKADIHVIQLPKTVIISTGDELVPVAETPELHQIRRSNVYGIQATLKEWGMHAELQHLADNKNEMLASIRNLLGQFDVLIFTGGVSKGKFDYLPEVLEQLNIKKHFHKIQQRPGKPFWFGTNATQKTIFALPGNPVSSFVCVYVYFKHWLQQSLGIPQEKMYVKLKKDVFFEPNIVYFLEAKLQNLPNGTLVADPVKGNGSGDFANLVNTDGFLILPQEKNEFKKGEIFEFIRYRSKF